MKIVRRGFLSMLGMAPVAAMVQPDANPSFGAAAPRIMPSPWMDEEPVKPLTWAKRKVAAIRWADRNGMGMNEPVSLSTAIDHEVQSMRSWSPQHKARVIQSRQNRNYKERYLQEAIRSVEREVKLSMAPEWMRRFL